MRRLKVVAIVATLAVGLACVGVCLSLLSLRAFDPHTEGHTCSADRVRYLRPASRFAAGLTRGLAYAGLSLAILAAVLVFLVPRVSGVRFATILSDSMRPAMTTGDMIVVRPVDPGQIEIGDVILFPSPADSDATIAHRVVEVVGSGGSLAFVTRGDANEVPDRSPVSADSVLGEVEFHVPLLGHVVRQMKEPLVFLLALAVPGSLIIVGEVWSIIGALRREKPGEIGLDLGRDP
jgi:signal peptidase